MINTTHLVTHLGTFRLPAHGQTCFTFLLDVAIHLRHRGTQLGTGRL